MKKQLKFKDLPKHIQERICNKARWEGMTLSAVMNEWPGMLEGK